MPTDIALRASDADRERVARQLADHLAAGRLGLVEYDERVAAAYAAITTADLRPLLMDLPTQPAPIRQPSTPMQHSAWPAWTTWTLVTAICLTIWAATSVAAQDVEGFWPFWVFGPWGVVLLIRTVGLRSRD